ncbi:hypothetical protein SUGI_0511060 [Cryptomeria japonica]|nr:hypothetical protein SUGI_0511060 [Cryptomeria japonica]
MDPYIRPIDRSMGPVFFVSYILHISEDRYSTRFGGFVEKGRFNFIEPPDIGIAKGTIHFFIDLSPMMTRNKQIRNSTSNFGPQHPAGHGVP